MATKSISQLDTTAAVNNGTLLEVATPDSGSASGYMSEKMSVSQLADHAANDIVYPELSTTAQSIVGAINEVFAAGGFVVTGTLAAGNTSITLSNAGIHTTGTFDFYTDVFGVNPTAVVVAEGSITLTFEEQASDVGVKVRCL